MALKVIGPEEYLKLVELSEEIEERLGWLLNDDPDQIRCIKVLIGSFLYDDSDCQAPQSKEARDWNLKTASLAEELADRLNNGCWGPRMSEDADRLMKVGDFLRRYAETRDPKGKPTPRNLKHKGLAHGICRLIYSNKLNLELRTAPDSDLAKVFRLCCEAIGISVPSNVSHYLKSPVDWVHHQQAIQKES